MFYQNYVIEKPLSRMRTYPHRNLVNMHLFSFTHWFDYPLHIQCYMSVLKPRAYHHNYSINLLFYAPRIKIKFKANL